MRTSLRRQVLREWHPFRGEEDGPAKPAALPAHQLVPHVMRGLGLEKRLHQSQVLLLWPNIVGPDIAAHAQPMSLRNGVLVVAVDHPIWLQELSRFHKRAILEKIQLRVGKSAVSNISFRIG